MSRGEGVIFIYTRIQGLQIKIFMKIVLITNVTNIYYLVDLNELNLFSLVQMLDILTQDSS